jgi:hypothetical protein
VVAKEKAKRWPKKTKEDLKRPAAGLGERQIRLSRACSAALAAEENRDSYSSIQNEIAPADYSPSGPMHPV